MGEQTTALADHFRGAGILVRPFAGEGVRVSVGTTSDNERVLAAAAAWILFAVIIVLTALQFQAQKKWVHYEY